MIQQSTNSGARFKIFCDEFVRIRTGYLKTLIDQKLNRFWDLLQTVLENVISDHLNIWRSMSSEKINAEEGTLENRQGRKTLFSFENTSFSSTSNTSLLKKKVSKFSKNDKKYLNCFYITSLIVIPKEFFLSITIFSNF